MPGIEDNAARAFAWVVRTIADDARRNRNRMRRGKVVEADPEKGLYRAELRPAKGDEPAFLSPWVTCAGTAAGGVKIQAEPTVGEWVILFSESGELVDAVIVMSGFFDDEPRPHDKNGELKTTVGGGYDHLIDSEGKEETRAKERKIKTEGDVTFETSGVVRFT